MCCALLAISDNERDRFPVVRPIQQHINTRAFVANNLFISFDAAVWMEIHNVKILWTKWHVRLSTILHIRRFGSDHKRTHQKTTIFKQIDNVPAFALMHALGKHETPNTDNKNHPHHHHDADEYIYSFLILSRSWHELCQ